MLEAEEQGACVFEVGRGFDALKVGVLQACLSFGGGKDFVLKTGEGAVEVDYCDGTRIGCGNGAVSDLHPGVSRLLVATISNTTRFKTL